MLNLSIAFDTLEPTAMLHGVPLDSVLRPILFTDYVWPLDPVIHRFGLQYHMYADDTQILASGPAG